MDKKYITLFKDLAQATAASAEAVMDYDREKGDEKGLETATTMHDDFQELAGRLIDEYEMTQPDAARLLVAAMIQVNQLLDRINILKKAVTGYQSDVIPKLQDIVDNAKEEGAAAQMANEKFVIKEEN